jgi:hypothetical protein
MSTTGSQPTATAEGLRVPGTFHYLFASSAIYQGNLGGISGADAKCQALATGAGLAGTYVSLVSTSATFANRVTVSGYVYNRRGLLLATSKADLFDGTLTNAVDYDEYGSYVTGKAWTGSTAGGGNVSSGCANWTYNCCAPGQFGLVNSASSALSSSTEDCTVQNRIYCISQ